jgi:N-ethylmaleimide reductase
MTSSNRYHAGADGEMLLLQPYLLGDLQLRNRIVMAPLTRTRAENPGHVPTDLMRQYYEQRASAGLIISEGVWVSENGQGWYGAPGIYNEEQRDAWKVITDAVHTRGGRIFAQLWHQGVPNIPSADEVKKNRNEVNEELRNGFED